MNDLLQKTVLTKEPLELPLRRIEPRKFSFPTVADWKELFASGDLIMMLISRDLSSRYRRAVLGGLWAVLQPLLTVLAFSFVINRVMRVPSDGIPYMLYVWSGIILWQFLAGTVLSSSTQTYATAQLVDRVYFPRLVLPISTLGRPFVDLAVNAVFVLIATVVVFQIPLSTNVLWLPVFIGLAALTTLGVTCWTSALCVVFYDFMHLLPFVLQVFFITTPVMYSLNSVPANWTLVYYLNPIAAAINGFRWSIVGAGLPPNELYLVSFAVAFVLATSGVLFYFHISRWFSDLL